MRELLGAQWPAFVAATPPKKRHLVPASNAFAAAVGVPADEGIKTDIAFGGVPPRLLNLIDEWPGKVESDLNRFWHIDYRDRWRFTRRGQRKLTLRQIHERLSNLPVDSALAIAINNGRLHYTNTDLLLMDLFELWPSAGTRPGRCRRPRSGNVMPSQPNPSRTQQTTRPGWTSAAPLRRRPPRSAVRARTLNEPYKRRQPMPKDEKNPPAEDQESSTVTVEFNGQKFTIPPRTPTTGRHRRGSRACRPPRPALCSTG